MPREKKKPRKPLRGMRVLRENDPKGTKTTKRKDGETFSGGKNKKGRPKPTSKGNLVCKQIGRATVCFDKGKPKRSDGKSVKPNIKRRRKKKSKD